MGSLVKASSLRLACGLLVLFMGSGLAHAQDSAPVAEFTVSHLEARLAAMRPHVEKVLGYKIQSMPSVQAVGIPVIYDTCVENMLVFASQIRDEEDRQLVQETQHQVAGVLAECLMGYYDVAAHRILIVPSVLIAECQRNGQEIVSPRVLDLLLVHELTHHAQSERYDLGSFLGRARHIDQMPALVSVSEGHAEFVALRVAEALGWGRAWTQYSELVGGKNRGRSTNLDEHADQIATALLTFPYVQGRLMFERLDQTEGARVAVERLFRFPPPDKSVVLSEGTVDSLPKTTYDLQSLSKQLQDVMPPGIQSQHLPISASLLKSLGSLLPADKVDAVVPHLQAGMMRLGRPVIQIHDAQIVSVGVFVTRSADAANPLRDFMIEVTRAQQRMVLETIEGAEVLSSHEESVDMAGSAVFLMRRQVKIPGLGARIRGFAGYVVLDDLVLEISSSSFFRKKAEFLEFVEEVMKVVRQPKLRSMGRIQLTLTAESGVPVRHAHRIAIWHEADASGPVFQGFTSGLGTLSTELLPSGNCELRIRAVGADEDLLAPVPLIVGKGATVPVQLKVPLGGALAMQRIEGRIESGSSQAVPSSGTLRLWPLTANLGPIDVPVKEGRFAVDLPVGLPVTTGMVWLQGVHHEDLLGKSFLPTPDEEWTLEVAVRKTTAMKVVSEANGEGIHEAKVYGTANRSWSGPDIIILGTLERRYWLTGPDGLVHMPDDELGDSACVVAQGRALKVYTLRASEDAPIVVEMVPGGTVVIEVSGWEGGLDAAHHFAPSLIIRARDGRERTLSVRPGSDTRHWKIPGLPAGSYDVMVLRSDSDEMRGASFLIKSGEETRVRLVL